MIPLNWRKVLLVAAVAVLLVAVFAVAYLDWASTRISSSGTVSVIGLDASVDHVDWGTVWPGDSVTRNISVVPAGSVPVTLAVITGNYTPSNMSGYSRLTWDYANQTLDPGQWFPVNLTLQIFANVTGITEFSFDITIRANAA